MLWYSGTTLPGAQEDSQNCLLSIESQLKHLRRYICPLPISLLNLAPQLDISNSEFILTL